MKWPEFIAALGVAAAWPMVARGQQPTMPVVGFLSWLPRRAALEFRWAEGEYGRFGELAADLLGVWRLGHPCKALPLCSSRPTSHPFVWRPHQFGGFLTGGAEQWRSRHVSGV
jgi:hypothetical protein